MFKFSNRSLDKLSKIHPELVKVCHKALELSDIDFGIVQGVRTYEEQKELYAQGRTKPGPIVTWTMNSNHLQQADGYGHAIDFGVYLNGEYINGDTPDEQKWYEKVVPFFKEAAKICNVEIVCGAEWVNPDLPHISLSSAYRK